MKSCPYCNCVGKFYFEVKSRAYYRCRVCDLIYKDVQEDYKSALSVYSNGGYFHRYTCDQTDRLRDKLYDSILDLIEEKKSFGSLLDVGTGFGFFLSSARKRGWSVKGIEPSRQSVQDACRQNNLDVFCGTLQEFSCNDQFDVITFINVLDHSAEPWREIKRASDMIAPGGIVYLRFPNGFLHTRLYQQASKFGLDGQICNYLVFHQFSFTSKFIHKLLSDSGFVEVSVMNSPPSEGDPHNLFHTPALAQYVKRTLYLIAEAIRFFSYRKILVGTSLEVIAIKPKSIR